MLQKTKFVDEVNIFYTRGAHINRRDKDNYTPLLLAATYGNVDTVEMLLQKGADYTAVDKYDKTAIFMAAEENKYKVLEVNLIAFLSQFYLSYSCFMCLMLYLNILNIVLLNQ